MRTIVGMGVQLGWGQRPAAVNIRMAGPQPLEMVVRGPPSRAMFAIGFTAGRYEVAIG